MLGWTYICGLLMEVGIMELFSPSVVEHFLLFCTDCF